MNNEITMVLGASAKPGRISGSAIEMLRAAGHQVVAIGASGGMVAGVPIEKGIPEGMQGKVATLTLYLNPKNQASFYNDILDLKPRRIIFNPGAENTELEALARKNGIQTEEACTLVMLSIGSY